jgi:colicin import membrane protein
MEATADRLDFAPPPEPAAVRGFVLAVIAHLLLMIALTWGINWTREDTTVAAEAELWSSLPEQAAPPPAPPVPAAPPVVQAPPVPEKVTPPPLAKEPDIAIEREKKRREDELRRRQEEDQRKLEAQKKKLLEEQARREEAAKDRAAKEKLAKEQAAKDKTKRELDTKKLEALRQENIKRLQGLAGTSGSPSATGTALRNKGPSATYAGRIAARIKPNIVFTDVVTGNPKAEVEIRVAPDGTIVGIKLLKSSGIKSWDEAVMRAVEKTGSIPRDSDGTVVPEFPIGFSPKD